jgi:hypothetical protein
MKAETATVTNAEWMENVRKGSAITAPVEDATTSVTTGRIHAEVMDGMGWSWTVILQEKNRFKFECSQIRRPRTLYKYLPKNIPERWLH